MGADLTGFCRQERQAGLCGGSGMPPGKTLVKTRQVSLAALRRLYCWQGHDGAGRFGLICSFRLYPNLRKGGVQGTGAS
jgi:hypothetical protein